VELNGLVTFRSGTSAQGLIAEWPGLARLDCSRDGTRFQVTAHGGAGPQALQKLRGFIRVLLSERRGSLGLHAAAACLGSRAVLILGDSGAGKSTAAAELCLRYGGKLLADDAACLRMTRGSAYVQRTERLHFLSDESCVGLRLSSSRRVPNAAKQLIPAVRAASRSCRLGLVAFLRFDDSVAETTCRAVHGYEAVLLLLRSVLRFDVEDKVARQRELDQLVLICEQSSVIEIVRRRHEPQVGAILVRKLKACAGEDE